MAEWISTEEAEKLSGYRADYLRKLVRQKTIKGKKVAFSVLIERDSLLQYKNKQDEKKELASRE